MIHMHKSEGPATTAIEAASPRALPIQGVGQNAIVFCECDDGRAPLAYMVDRNAFTDEQWARLNEQAAEWARILSRPPVQLRVI